MMGSAYIGSLDAGTVTPGGYFLTPVVRYDNMAIGVLCGITDGRDPEDTAGFMD